MKTINHWHQFTVSLRLVIFSRYLKVLYQAYTNVGSLKLYFTEVLDYAPIIRTSITKFRNYFNKEYKIKIKT